MNENQTINVALTIDEIKYAAKVIRKDATRKPEEATLAKLERIVEAYEFVEKRKAKRKKEAEAAEREAKAVALLSRGAMPPAPCLLMAGDFVRAFGFTE